jgi:hypothetical protein
MLWQDGSVTIESLGRGGNLKGKNVSKAIIKSVNTATGKESAKDKAFTELNWGTKTRSYLASVKKLSGTSFAKIAIKAQGFAKMSAGRVGDSSLTGELEEDERACLVDVSDGEDNGMFIISEKLLLTIAQMNDFTAKVHIDIYTQLLSNQRLRLRLCTAIDVALVPPPAAAPHPRPCLFPRRLFILFPLRLFCF